MANIRHSKISGIANPIDPTLVGGEDWDAAHDVTLLDADIPATIARDTEVTAAVAALSTVYQPLDSDLTAIAALTTTAYGRAFLALADAAAGRTALGLGTAATQATGAFDAAGAAAAAQAASQPLDSDLTAIAALTTTSFGRGLLALADAAAARSTLGLGTAAVAATGDFDAAGAAAAAQAASQPLDSDLTAFAGLAIAADKLPYGTGSHTLGLADLTAAGRALLDDADAAAQRTTLGLGTLATQSGTFSGTSSGTNTGDQTLPTRASLGLDTTDSPQFAGLNVGAATDTTITRTGAGDVAVEGNAIYRAGGTDVPVADGGTGSSTAGGARTNLGLVIGTDVGVPLTVEEVDASPSDSAVTKIVFPNGTLGIASHVATYTPVAAGAGALVYITKQTASTSANLSFTSVFSSTYDVYEIVMVNILPATDGVGLHLLASTDGGSNYLGATNYAWSYTRAGGSQASSGGALPVDGFADGLSGNTAAYGGVSGTLRLYNPLSATAQKTMSLLAAYRALDGTVENVNGTGVITTTTAVNALRFLFSSGNITSGTIYIYGLTKS